MWGRRVLSHEKKRAEGDFRPGLLQSWAGDLPGAPETCPSRIFPRPPGTSFLAPQPAQSRSTLHGKGPALGLMLCCHHL